MQRDVFAPQPVRIAFAVEPFMMMTTAGIYLCKEACPAQDRSSMLAVAHDLAVLLLIQRAILEQDIVRES